MVCARKENVFVMKVSMELVVRIVGFLEVELLKEEKIFNVMMDGLAKLVIIKHVLIIAITMVFVIMVLVFVIRSSVENHVVILPVKMDAMEMEIVSKENVNVIKGSLKLIVVKDMFIEASCILMVAIYVMMVGLVLHVMKNYVRIIAMIKGSVTMVHVHV